MGTLKESKKKAQEASSSVMKVHHEAKGNALRKWTKWIKDRDNPDCYTLEGHIVVRLDKVTESNVEAALETGDIFGDKSGHYYGDICEMSG
ncbi:hypothetical protein [Caenispirillum bisanense]|uniref:Uncharacterized protein n=1 Tax=Caenispirillum bisanense TaxID=414052 RepID=A0A286G1B9_9PROT|nr:hypothetical protein [Caenispirillum bisanense]SOD89331.1 hypothetical protein SAMN05421508_101184 [Caenispirillum bisanense]